MGTLDNKAISYTETEQKLMRKEEPYSENNTVVYYGFCTHFVDTTLKKSQKKTVNFIKFARTYPKWDSEVRLYSGNELTDITCTIRDNMFEAPKDFTHCVCSPEALCLDCLKQTQGEKKKGVPKRYKSSGLVFVNGVDKCGTCVHNSQCVTDSFDVDLDVIRFTAAELSALYNIPTKKELLNSPAISHLNKLFLNFFYWPNNKFIVPTDVIYTSLYDITLQSSGAYGITVKYFTKAMKEMKNETGLAGYLRAVPVSELTDFDYMSDDFDYFNVMLRFNATNSTLLNRRTLGGFFRTKQLKM